MWWILLKVPLSYFSTTPPRLCFSLPNFNMFCCGWNLAVGIHYAWVVGLGWVAVRVRVRVAATVKWSGPTWQVLMGRYWSLWGLQWWTLPRSSTCASASAADELTARVMVLHKRPINNAVLNSQWLSFQREIEELAKELLLLTCSGC